ncbi:hypothetical protein [Pseudanabaena sp. ABRG5-3]|nr:hypothetical protein [Pseudanabaena sp. ABRG5-3]
MSSDKLLTIAFASIIICLWRSPLVDRRLCDRQKITTHSNSDHLSPL